MKKVLLLIFSSLTFGVFAQDTAFISTFGGIQNEVCNQVKPTLDNGYILIGTTNSFGCGNTDMYVIKTDSFGRKEWSKAVGGQLNDEGFAVEATYDHGYACLGWTNSFGNGGYDVYLVKLDSMGNQVWQQTYGGNDWDFGYDIKQLPDSGFIICGQTYSYGPANGNVYVIRTDKYGDTLWTKTVGGDGYDIANSVCAYGSSYYIAGGTTSFGSGDTSMYFIKMNNKGQVLIDTTYYYGSPHSFMANSVSMSVNNQDVFLCGYEDTTLGKSNYGLIMVDADTNGKLQWLQYDQPKGTSMGKQAMQLANWNILMIGTTNASGLGASALWPTLTNSGGWWIASPSFGGTGMTQGNSITQAKNGNVVMVGQSNSPGYSYGLFDVYMVRVKTDTIVMNYTLRLHTYLDTCKCYLTVPTQSALTPGVKLFPNPVSTNATILLQGDIEEYYWYTLYNEMGQDVSARNPFTTGAHGQSVANFDRGNLSPGVYFFKVEDHLGNKVATGKFIVE